MNKRKLFIIAALLVMLLAFTIMPASAEVKPNRIYVDVVEVFCEYHVGTAWVDEQGVYHERGSTEVGFKIPLSDEDPFPYGEFLVEVNLDLYMANGNGFGYGDVLFSPDDSDGDFNGWWKGILVEAFPGVWLVSTAHAGTTGTGELEGWSTIGYSYSIDPTPYAGMCEGGDPFGVSLLHLTYKPPIE